MNCAPARIARRAVWASNTVPAPRTASSGRSDRAFSIEASAFGMVIVQAFNGAGDTTTPFLVILAQTAVAIFAEWVLIFGNLGAPALGVRGAALV